MFVDSHCHLEGRQFEVDRAEVLQRARESGIEALLAIGNGSSSDSLDCGIRVSEQETPATPRIFTSIGIHPHEASMADGDVLQRLSELAHAPKVVAWGEIGLDYHYNFSPRERQRLALVQQMEAARTARLPIIIHCRASEGSSNAWDDTLQLLERHWSSSGLGGILHCFTGERAHAQRALDIGFMLSFAGNITFPKAENIRQAALYAPLDRILIETDSPYLAPVPHRGRRNEPAFVKEVAIHIGQLRRLPSAEVAFHTTQNFYRFFGLNQEPFGR